MLIIIIVTVIYMYVLFNIKKSFLNTCVLFSFSAFVFINIIILFDVSNSFFFLSF